MTDLTLQDLLLSIATGGLEKFRVHKRQDVLTGESVEVLRMPGEHPGLWEELQTTIARLSKMGGGSAGTGARSAGSPMPYHDRASDTAAQLGNAVVTWARLIAEENQDLELTATSVPGAAQWTAHWLTVFPSLVDEHGEEMLADLTRWVRKAERVIDHGPDRIFAGRCETPLTEEGRRAVAKDPDADVPRCMADIYARKDTCPNHEEPAADCRRCKAKGFASCRECGAVHDVAYRKQWLSKHLASSLVTAAEAAPILSWKLDKDIKVDTINKWRLRGRLADHGHRDGRPLYRFSEVEALAIEVKTRQGKPKAKREGSAA